MLEIAKDGGGRWCYNGTDCYVFFNKSGKKSGILKMQHVPDPYKIWESKARQGGFLLENGDVDYSNDFVMSLRPSQAVFKLWEHKNA